MEGKEIKVQLSREKTKVLLFYTEDLCNKKKRKEEKIERKNSP